MTSWSMETSTISAILHSSNGTYYVTIPKKTAQALGIKTGDPVAVKISSNLTPEGF